MNKKKKPQDIQSIIATKSFASLDREIENILSQQKEDRPIEELFASETTWGSGGPPHMVRGKIIE